MNKKMKIINKINQGESLSSIARSLKVSRQYVHQIKNKELDKTSQTINTLNKDEDEFLQDGYFNFINDEVIMFSMRTNLNV